ncbi:AAA family ATPase [Trichocoleus sp. FACHB-90]|uniref:ATPase domain-containing protein n=1 Tax=Cyanophyceae TaxID=3028117 RepID=UPI00168959C3|nr:ATPase domain-containing protein [Trichocoleus sp. FACHB-90]MBD1925178.1 AAA family ATPase [Trichocoleus sp. FACHB-90]
MLQDRLSTGISGLDEVLHGGLVPACSYLVRGGPGSGKTTLGLHFLAAGIANGEKTLYITLGESAQQIGTNGDRLGFDMKGMTFLDLSPTSEFFTQIQTYDIFSPAEVEREPTTQKIIESVETLKPKRVVLDAITQFRYLSADAFQFRKQVLSFIRFLLEQGATVIFTSEGSDTAPDDDLQFISDGVINLNHDAEGRTLNITKFRGSNFHSGLHSMRLTNKGMGVSPRLQPEVYKREFAVQSIPSGVPELDELLHGGIERGTVTIFTGSTGVGKTTIGLQFMKEAAGRGERSVVYCFEEPEEILLHRCESVNIPVHAMSDLGTLSVIAVEPLHFSPDEFANMVRQEVEQKKARIVMIDSVAGYRLSLRGEDLISHLHALCKYLQNMGVTVILVNELETITGDFRATDVGISYMADNIIFLRYIEVQGQLRKAIGVLKKRMSDFEKTMREIEISRYGIKVGKPLTNLRGILSGMPELIGKQENE